MRLGSNIAVKNVLQVYMTTTMIFYSISSQKVRTSHALKQEYGSSSSWHFMMNIKYFVLLLQLFQMYNSKANYLGWENLIEWITYIFALLLVIDFTSCQQDTGIREVRRTLVNQTEIFEKKIFWLKPECYFHSKHNYYTDDYLNE